MEYSVKIREASFEMSARDKLRYKDTSTALDLNSVTEDGEFIINDPVNYLILDIHNDKAKDNPDYTKYVVIDAAGNSYITGSESFWRSFREIFDEMKDENDSYSIEVRQVESNNYKGKSFIKCAIV